MAIEIERKYLVSSDSWETEAGTGLRCSQGYLSSDKEKTVRVRIMGDKAFLTVKGMTHGISRTEYEYEIPVSDARSLLDLCGELIEKTRYFIPHKGLVWELDVFKGENEGLILAEVELESEQQEIELPDWAGREVSEDKRYYNACLAKFPFSTWQ